MKTTPLPNNHNLCIAVYETSNMESETAQIIYRKLQEAIDNNCAVIYNGNDEKIKVPFIARLHQLHPDFVKEAEEYEGPFDGWDNSTHIFMVDGSRCSQDQFIDIVAKNFSNDIIKMWAQSLKLASIESDLPIFLGKGCLAIHCDQNDGTWFEYIIEGE